MNKFIEHWEPDQFKPYTRNLNLIRENMIGRKTRESSPTLQLPQSAWQFHAKGEIYRFNDSWRFNLEVKFWEDGKIWLEESSRMKRIRIRLSYQGIQCVSWMSIGYEMSCCTTNHSNISKNTEEQWLAASMWILKSSIITIWEEKVSI